MLPDQAHAGQTLSLNELCRGEKTLQQKGKGMSGRVSQPCREGDRAAGQGAASGKGACAGSSQLPWETTTSMALPTNCTAFLPPPLPFLQFIFLTRSMMLLQTENNRDRVSAKAISELNRS